MTHDPLCGLSQPCDDEIRDHGYCLLSHGKFCIHCNQWCICPQLQQAKEEVAQRIIKMADIQAEVAAAMASEEMLAKCVAAVEAMDIHGPHPYKGVVHCNCVGSQIVAVLRALDEQS